MKPLIYLAEAALFFLMVGLFRACGLRGASALGGWIARTIGPHTSQHRGAKRRLRRAMPEVTDGEAEEILRRMWDNLGRTMGELPHLDKLSRISSDQRLFVEGEEVLDKVGADGKGAIFFSGHFANWEVTPIPLIQRGIASAEVYRAPNNPYVDRWLTHQRRTNVASTQIPKGAAGAKELIAFIKAKGIVAMLLDQKMSDGIEAPFFGLPAMSPPAAAQLHLRHGLPLVPVSSERLPQQKFRIHIYPPLEIEQTGDRTRDIYLLMVAINKFLEAQVRARPEQWLWLHKRWAE